LDGNLYIAQALPVPQLLRTLSGHKEGICDLVWSNSNDMLLSASLDCSVRVWNALSGHCLRSINVRLPLS
jgi:WD40 repeat protein